MELFVFVAILNKSVSLKYSLWENWNPMLDGTLVAFVIEW